MQVLEKILKEIEQKIEKAEKIIVKPAHDKLDEVANDTAEAFIEAYKECQDIIRKYMENDGWISVNSYGLPKDEGVYDLTIINGLEEYVSVRWQFLSGTHLSGTQHYVDGVHYWADNYRGDPINEFLSERVIAWRKKTRAISPGKESGKMTPEEAIEILDNEYKRIELQIMSLKGTIKENTESFRYRIDVKESLKTAITALEEIQQYRAIGTVEEFRGAMEKQKPNKPHRNYKKFSGLWCKCGWYLGQKQCLDIKYCPNCGQKIDFGGCV